MRLSRTVSWIPVALAVALAVGAAASAVAGDEIKISRKGEITIITEDEDGDRHEKTFEFDGDNPRPLLGVMVEENEDGRGVWIEKVIEDSAAESAGLQAGDLVTAVDGEPVDSSWDLTRRILQSRPGDRIDLDVVRDGRERTLRAELGEDTGWVGAFAHRFDHDAFKLRMDELHERLGDMDFDFNFDFGGPGDNSFHRFRAFGRPVLGVQLSEATPELREHLGGPADAGVLVGRVMPNMPAEDAGVRVGDLIVGVNGDEIESSGDLVRALRDQAGETIELELIRDGRSMTLDVDLPEREEATQTSGPRARA